MPYYIPSPGHDAPDATLQVFEREYHAKNDQPGYWGPVEASIDWCERNYVVSYYVAEWWNTVSNIVLIALGTIGLYHTFVRGFEPRFVVLSLATLTIGCGSALFHGTLTHVGQQGDETPMVLGMSAWIYCLVAMDPRWERRHPHGRPALGLGLTLFCAVFAVAHYYLRLVVTFQVCFGILVFSALALLLRHIGRTKQAEARQLGMVYIQASLLGFAAWLVDVHHCETMHDLPFGIPNPQFHAWWHALTAIGCYAGPAFLCFRRAHLLGQRPGIAWRFGCVPVVELFAGAE